MVAKYSGPGGLGMPGHRGAGSRVVAWWRCAGRGTWRPGGARCGRACRGARGCKRARLSATGSFNPAARFFGNGRVTSRVNRDVARIECVRGDRAGACSRCWPVRRPLDRHGYIDMGTDTTGLGWCAHSLPHLERCFLSPPPPSPMDPPAPAAAPFMLPHHVHRRMPIIQPPQGKSVNNKDTLEDKKDDNELWEAQAAFLGPNLWDKTLPYDPDLKYVDLDEFLSENGMQGEALGGAHLGGSAFGAGAGLALGLQAPVTKRERSPSPSDCMSPDTINPPLSPADSTFSMASSGRDFDPRTRAFSDEELKPQPMIKKSRKQVNEFVPDDLKDDKYWARRRKNNMAAKRSRDARRMKENQIALRAGYLEKENMGLRQEVELLKKENHILREKLSKYADV
ncbi:hepatic leukemia factor isoform X2 [Cydia pomonella]|uniref:hepatic leukemia factor isoform X2 n=1 Tax=Cydia pomonella TaxID=82600 RepID=UPI002ADD5C2A|nr:hepatic leukemia factor isoform X2 [Cydia pomonella]